MSGDSTAFLCKILSWINMLDMCTMFVNRFTAEVYFQEWPKSRFSLKQQYISQWTAHENLYWRIVEFSEVVLVKMYDCVLAELRLKESMALAKRQEGINLAVTCLYSLIVCWHILIKQQKIKFAFCLLMANTVTVWFPVTNNSLHSREFLFSRPMQRYIDITDQKRRC